jgi:hypothetical protein
MILFSKEEYGDGVSVSKNDRLADTIYHRLLLKQMLAKFIYQ